MTNKKVFISYAWTNDTFSKQILKLATKLRIDGVDIIFDKWDLKPGDDKFLFMEKSVEASDKIIIICNKEYKKKADNRTGGAGQETSIIAPDIYERTDKSKIIPIIFEKDKHGTPFVPTYLKSRIYIDFTDRNSSNSYKELFCAIHNTSLIQKPKLGNIIPYTFKSNNTLNYQHKHQSHFKERIDKIFTMISNCGYWNKSINLEKLGELIGLKSVNKLNQFYYNDVEPPYEILDKISEVLGLNPNWLKYGEGEPYQDQLAYHYNINCIFEEINNHNYKYNNIYFFTQNDTRRQELGIILKKSEFIYSCYPRAFVFHSQVGASGTRELYSVFNFFRELKRIDCLPIEMHFVSSEDFSDFIKGKKFPGMINSIIEKDMHMIDDFLDLYKTTAQRQRYLNWYGENFVTCQDCIKHYISSHKS